ncbi:MAG: ATP-binding protein [Lentisphaerota bacterium]
MLDTVIKGKKFEPPRIMVYGPEGIGKSTFGASAPNPIFIQIEDGLSQIDCHRFPKAEKLDDVDTQLNLLLSEEHEYQTLVIDSADWLEKLIFEWVCARFGVSVVEKADGGWGNGYKQALNIWSELLKKLDTLRTRKGMAIVFLAHSDTRTVKDPESQAYDQFTPRLQKLAAAMITEWVDAIFFATRKMRVEKDGDRMIARPIGANGGERVMRTVGSASCVAKSRYSMPDELPLSWDSFMSAIAKQ